MSVVGSYSATEYADRYRKSDRNRVHERKPGYVGLEYDLSFGDRGSLDLSAYYEDYGLTKTEDKFLPGGALDETEKETFDTQLYGVDLLYLHELASHSMTLGVSHQGYKAKEMTVQELFPGGPPMPALHDMSAHPSSIGIFGQISGRSTIRSP